MEDDEPLFRFRMRITSLSIDYGVNLLDEVPGTSSW